jgi:sugar phosphate permease
MLVIGSFGVMGLGAFYPALTESLPKHIRGRAVATIYATSIAIFGGTAQLMVTWLIHVTGNPLAMVWYLMGATVVGLTAMILIVESAPGHALAGLEPVENIKST